MEYAQLLAFVKERIQQAQIKTVAVANSQMLWLYWQLGNTILANQANKGWGAKVIDLLSADLKKEFPAMKGFSARNMLYMKQFAEAYHPAVLQAYIFMENKIKAANQMSQSLAKELLAIEKGGALLTQQPVAQIASSNNQVISQQPVAQLQTTDNQLLRFEQAPDNTLAENTFFASILSKIS